MILRITVAIISFSILLLLSNNTIKEIQPISSQKPLDTFKDLKTMQLSTKEIVCLAKNMYYEARGESSLGIILVGVVTLNRTSKEKSVCEVVYAPKQFSWTAQNVRMITRLDLELFMSIAKQITKGQYQVPERFAEATHYHAVWIKDPAWTKKLEFLGIVGNHKFYKEKPNALFKHSTTEVPI